MPLSGPHGNWESTAAGSRSSSFLICCLVSTATGTSLGTMILCAPLLYPAAAGLGTDPVILMGAVIGGATFGDNISPVSDTTIASASTQGADIGGVVRSRLKYAFPAALARGGRLRRIGWGRRRLDRRAGLDRQPPSPGDGDRAGRRDRAADRTPSTPGRPADRDPGGGRSRAGVGSDRRRSDHLHRRRRLFGTGTDHRRHGARDRDLDLHHPAVGSGGGYRGLGHSGPDRRCQQQADRHEPGAPRPGCSRRRRRRWS